MLMIGTVDSKGPFSCSVVRSPCCLCRSVMLIEEMTTSNLRSVEQVATGLTRILSSAREYRDDGYRKHWNVDAETEKRDHG